MKNKNKKAKRTYMTKKRKHQRDVRLMVTIILFIVSFSLIQKCLIPTELAEASGEYLYNHFPEADDVEIQEPVSTSDYYWQLIKKNKEFGSYVHSINVRNNNPGNLLYAGQPNATPCDYRGFACFPSPEIGFRALVMQIDLDQTRDLTIEEFIHKYSPPHENDTVHLIREASRKLDVDKNTNIDVIDTFKLAQVMASQEFGIKIVEF